MSRPPAELTAAESSEPASSGRLQTADGDAAFTALVADHYGSTARFARLLTPDRETAVGVVQAAWKDAIDHLDQVPAQGALRSWLYGFLVDRLELALADRGAGVPAVAHSAFEGEDDLWPGHWASDLEAWQRRPDRAALERAIRDLPRGLGAIVLLHDVDGLSSAEIEQVLGFDADDQRILLHRARTTIRRSLEAQLEGRS